MRILKWHSSNWPQARWGNVVVSDLKTIDLQFRIRSTKFLSDKKNCTRRTYLSWLRKNLKSSLLKLVRIVRTSMVLSLVFEVRLSLPVFYQNHQIYCSPWKKSLMFALQKCHSLDVPLQIHSPSILKLIGFPPWLAAQCLKRHVMNKSRLGALRVGNYLDPPVISQ